MSHLKGSTLGDTMPIQSVNIEKAVDLVAESGRSAATRASMLMAYALNAAAQAPNASFHLPGFIQLIEAPQALTSEELNRFRAEFRNWTVGNGLRELLQGTETFLNHLYRLTLSVERQCFKLPRDRATKLLRTFERTGVGAKFETLQRRYGFRTEFCRHFHSLTWARNCLTHRQGIVAKDDCSADGAFHLTWLGVDARATEGDGTEHFFTYDTPGPLDTSKFKGSGQPRLMVEFVDRDRPFPRGERISVSARELQEICSMAFYTCCKLHQLTINWLLDSGLPVNGGRRMEEPTARLLIEPIHPADAMLNSTHDG